jgi:hypothetical protein
MIIQNIKHADNTDNKNTIDIYINKKIGVELHLVDLIYNQSVKLYDKPYAPKSLVWEQKWIDVLHIMNHEMQFRVSITERFDAEILWIEYLSLSYVKKISIRNAAGWAAALEYLIANLHRRSVTYQEVSTRYQVAKSTVMRNVKEINRICQVKEKLQAMLSKKLGKREFS